MVVVHVESTKQALENARIAFDNGADGIFLINHDIEAVSLLGVYNEVRAMLQGRWIGLNLLGVEPVRALRLMPSEVNGFWLDDAGIEPFSQKGGFSTSKAKIIEHELLLQRRFDRTLYFGGVAFKYRAFVRNYEKAASLAVPFVDVITTSGAATGSAPTIDKIKAMRRGAGNRPIAIASGMTPENVDPFLDLADYFLVATGVSKSFTELDPVRVRQVAHKMRK